MRYLNEILLTALMVVSIGFAAQAQFGIKAMGNFTSVYGESEQLNGENIESIKFGPGFSVGLFYRAGEGVVSFQGELLYEMRNSTKNVNFMAPTPAGTIEVSSEIKNTYSFINLPLLAVFNLGNIKPYAGLNVAYLIAANGNSSTTMGPSTTETEIDYFNDNPFSDDPFFNQLEIGADIGVMFQLSEAFHLDLRLMHGLNDLTNNKYDQSLIDETSREDSDKSVGISLGVGLAF